MNVALPFSQIKLDEPSSELAELAALVFDLVGTMAVWVPEDELEELSARARVLRATGSAERAPLNGGDVPRRPYIKVSPIVSATCLIVASKNRSG